MIGREWSSGLAVGDDRTVQRWARRLWRGHDGCSESRRAEDAHPGEQEGYEMGPIAKSRPRVTRAQRVGHKQEKAWVDEWTGATHDCAAILRERREEEEQRDAERQG